MACSTKKGHHHLQGNVQVYNARIPVLGLKKGNQFLGVRDWGLVKLLRHKTRAMTWIVGKSSPSKVSKGQLETAQLGGAPYVPQTYSCPVYRLNRGWSFQVSQNKRTPLPQGLSYMACVFEGTPQMDFGFPFGKTAEIGDQLQKQSHP